ncbi:hypothetical protein QTO34_016867 [Cnephaeus nilssonii]|uniref:Uncharacterized protein n=1 Tax=Cnephaeus nilssonii TaxID=3371016 RepID=A0AA40I313_CNENI|nr:hypothetical protein QTO34_016867 [Eptesicus nilssonii]
MGRDLPLCPPQPCGPQFLSRSTNLCTGPLLYYKPKVNVIVNGKGDRADQGKAPAPSLRCCTTASHCSRQAIQGHFEKAWEMTIPSVGSSNFASQSWLGPWRAEGSWPRCHFSSATTGQHKALLDEGQQKPGGTWEELLLAAWAIEKPLGSVPHVQEHQPVSCAEVRCCHLSHSHCRTLHSWNLTKQPGSPPAAETSERTSHRSVVNLSTITLLRVTHTLPVCHGYIAIPWRKQGGSDVVDAALGSSEWHHLP